MKENQRKCMKCGRSPAIDPDAKLFRFPQPGIRNTLRCELWAKYCFPKEQCSTALQTKLYKEHRMLCDQHFKVSSFIDYITKKLHRYAVPEDYSSKSVIVPVPTVSVSQNDDGIGGDDGATDDVVVFADEEPQASGIEGVELITEEHNPPHYGDEIGNYAGVADDVVVFADEEHQATGIEVVELITEETYQEIPDNNQVMLPSSTIEQTTKNQKPELSKDTCTSAPDPINQLDLRSQTKLVGQHTLHPSGNKSYPPGPILKKRNMCTDKEMLTKYRSLNKRYWNLRRSHELMKKRCKKPNMFETLTADMNPVAKEFFRTQLIVKKDSRGARFSPEVKILALSVMKLSSECYKLLRKIFILPSKNTLNSLYHSVTGKDIMDGDNLGPNDRDVLNQLDNILLKTGDEVNHDGGSDLPEGEEKDELDLLVDDGIEGNELNLSDTSLHTKQNYHNMSGDDFNPTDSKLHVDENELNPADANLRLAKDELNRLDTKDQMNENNLNESVKCIRQYKLKQCERQTNVINRQSSVVAVSFCDTVVDKGQTFRRRHKSKVDGFIEHRASGTCKILRKTKEAVDTMTREILVNVKRSR